jgi:hypothetical protein
VHDRGRRRARTRRVSTAIAGLLVTALIGGGLVRALTPTRPVQFDQTRHPVEDTWVSTQYFRTPLTMEIRALDGADFGLAITTEDSVACAGPSTMTGTGRLEGTQLVIPTMVLECDDGTPPDLSDEQDEQDDMLRDYTLIYDTATDTLTDTSEREWVRQSTSTGAAWESHAMGVWPQANTDEVRKAQRRADAGDVRYAWQVSPALDADRAQGDAEIFTRFITEELGWEHFRRAGSSDDSASVSEHTSQVSFVRCAVGQSNPLYPDDPVGGDCAPTLDKYTYETVGVTAYQPFDSGPSGIWVVVSWQRAPSTRQTVPPSEAEVADILDAFGQARVDGEGAEAYLTTQLAETGLPLLYATSTGAPYERFEFKTVSSPAWPNGMTAVNLHLFADGGTTVVEQDFWLERAPSRWVLGHDRSDADHATTTENGVPAAEPYRFTFDGAPDSDEEMSVAFSLDPSWRDESLHDIGPMGQDAMAFFRPETAAERIEVVVDPLPPAEQCGVGTQPASASELARRIRSSPSLSVRAPVRATVGASDAVRLDVTAADRDGTCSAPPVLSPRAYEAEAPSPVEVGRDEYASVYLFDTPGEAGHTVAIMVVAPTFERVRAAAQPIIESLSLSK